MPIPYSRPALKVLILSLSFLTSVGAAAALEIEQPAQDDSARSEQADTQFKEGQRAGIPIAARGPVSTDELRELTQRAVENMRARQEKLWRRGMHPAGPSIFVIPIDPSTQVALNAPIRLEANPSNKAGTDFSLFRNTSLSTVIGANFRPVVPEPTVAAAGDRVFIAWNWYAADSFDQGVSFSGFNPSPGPFASPEDTRFCCDQVTVHDPGTNTLFYLQQFIQTSETGVQRINVDQNTDGTFDCAYDITPQTFGFPVGNWADFPNLALSDNYLYHASNVIPANGGFTGAFVGRYPLTQLSSCAETLIHDHLKADGKGAFRLTQGATDTMWFATHLSNSAIEIWTWPESSSSPTPSTHSVTPWFNGARTCTAPDGLDWCGHASGHILGAFVHGDQIGFTWTPAQDASHPFPYTRIARFAQSDLSNTSEADFYSNDFAIVYAAAASNASGHVGGVALFGGGSTYPSCLAWIVDDITGAPDFTNIETSVVTVGSSGPAINRSGDFLSVQPHSSYPDSWVATCFSYPDSNSSDPRFIWFGRERSGPPLPIFMDDFETGALDSWHVFPQD